MNNTSATPLAYPVVEAARLIGLGRTKVFALISNGELRSFRVGKKRLIPATELERFVQQRMLEAA